MTGSELQTNANKSKDPPRSLRAAATSIGVVIFLLVFRPFGLSIDSPTEVLVLLGVAPVCLVLMLGIHFLPLREGALRTIVALGVLVVGNTAYLLVWSQATRPIETTIAVALVAGLTALIAYLWNRGRIPEQDIEPGKIHAEALARPIVLSGDGEQEILQMSPDELLYLRANGNYVDVHYLKRGLPAKSMLRSSLANLAAQVPGNLLIQCHRSFFVNMASARRIIRAKGRTLIEFDRGEQVPVSRNFKQDVLRAISA